jgi:glucosyl-3-phosphoglycerate synthase
VLEEVERWLKTRSWSVTDRPLHKILAAKQRTGQSVSVVLPALNEEETVGDIVAVIRHDLVRQVPLVDEIVVVDSGSTDRTSEVAAAAGARVVHRDDILPRIPAVPGKGEVLWRSLLVTSGDIVCFIDADLKEFSSDFVSGIVGPLLTDPEVDLVKGMYDRPLRGAAGQGGRVTELMARPLLNMHWPQLAGFVQPLGGEYAARRSLLEQLPFPVGYGVELGMLVDALHLVGLDALAAPAGPRPSDPPLPHPVRTRRGRFRTAHLLRGHGGTAADGGDRGVRHAPGGLTEAVRSGRAGDRTFERFRAGLG